MTEREVGLFEAKTHLSELVAEVEAGASITLTRRGVPVARLVPLEAKVDRATALARLREIGREIKARGGGWTTEEILKWRREGLR